VVDLGATAKGLGADWAARAAMSASGAGGVVVSLGGDVALDGDSPDGGWPVLIADDHRQPASAPCTQVVRMDRGGLATSSIACRQWRRAGQALHHIIDPRTGQPAAGPWRTVSVAAATCADANAASTAAIICGEAAPRWLDGLDIPARLVGRDGQVVLTSGWPSATGGYLTCPKRRWLRLPDAALAGGSR
jgi:thiamine biosynthesis lipoprotein